MESESSRPNGLLLILMAGAMAVFGGVAGMLAEHRRFDIEPFGILFMGIPCFLIFCIFLMPATLVMLFLIRRKSLRPCLRTLLASIPSLAFVLPILHGGLVNPRQVQQVFAERMSHPLPAGASNLRSWYFHGIGERHYMFSFQTTPAATDDLLESAASKLVEHPAMLDPGHGVHFELPINGFSVPKGWPNPNAWHGMKAYRSGRIKDYCHILTDASKTRVFVVVGDT